MALWMRFEAAGANISAPSKATALPPGAVTCSPTPQPTALRFPLADVRVLTPCKPSKMIGLWNNFHERAEKEGLQAPAHPLYFLKTNSCFAAQGEAIRRPPGYDRHGSVRGRTGHRHRAPPPASMLPRRRLRSSATPASMTSPRAT
jgi:2-keto-4-pentenoate hydratase/2-oxohepta-3-ene-1,7-dioic acid hydratase in catechol pathway